MNRTLLVLLLLGLASLVFASGCQFPIEMAMDDTFMQEPIQAVCSSNAECYNVAYHQALDAGVTLKRSLISNDATTFNQTIVLPKWWNNPEAVGVGSLEQLTILRHEMVHVRQWAGYGPVEFPSMYIHEPTRWALEMQGFRQMVRDTVCLDQTGDVQNYLFDHLPKVMVEGYDWVMLDKGDVYDYTQELLMDEYDAWEGWEGCSNT